MDDVETLLEYIEALYPQESLESVFSTALQSLKEQPTESLSTKIYNCGIAGVAHGVGKQGLDIAAWALYARAIELRDAESNEYSSVRSRAYNILNRMAKSLEEFPLVQ